MTLDRWHRLMTQWRMPPNDDVYSEIASAYAEPHRRYHTRHHIEDCLVQLDTAVDIADSIEEVELALWFHDVIYEPISSKNELRSAEWARDFMSSNGVDDSRCDRVYSHILATRHGAESWSGDAALVLDIDLSILGRNPKEYDDFERSIREEYKWVPWPLYRRKRAEILSSFLGRTIIYVTERFRGRFEAMARQNLEAALEALSK